MLLSVSMVNTSVGWGPAKLSLDPPRLPEQSGTLGHPGDVFTMSVNIEKVEDLYAVGFTVKFAPYASVLVASDVAEGDFLSQGGYATAFVSSISIFAGTIKIGITRLGTVPGASGSGTLATFKFTVREAGESPIELIDVTLIDSNGNLINYDVWNSFYYGPTANLIRVEMPYGRVIKVGDYVEFKSKAKNHGDVPLYVRTRFDIERLEDGRRIKIYSGQNYAGGGLGEPVPFTYLYVDGYYEWLEWGWTNPGASLIGLPDGNAASSNTYSDITSMYTFEDINLAGRVILNVDIEGYTRQEDPGDDIDPYIFSYDEEGNSVLAWTWGDSMGWTTDWAWTGGKYYSGTPYDMPEYFDRDRHLWTEQGINSVEVLLHSYCLSGSLMEIDAMRWRLDFSPITPVEPPEYEIQPDEELELDPMTIAEVTEDMIGTYVATATLEYTLEGLFWNEGAKVRTFSFVIEP
jgi:hypothetical protein